MLLSTFTRLRGVFYRLFDSDISRRVVKNSGYLFSATTISGALSLLQGILIARLLGVAGFGILGAVTTFTSTINKLASFRMSELVVKYVGQYTEKGDQQRAAAIFKAAILTEMLASCFAFSLVWLLAPWGAQLLAKDPTTSHYFVTYGLIILANLIAESSTGLLQIFNRFRGIAVLTVIQGGLTLALIALAIFLQGGMFEVLLAYLAGKVFTASGITLVALQEARRQWGAAWWQTPLTPLRPQFRELASFAINTNLSASLNLVNKDSELLWVSLFRNPVETGYYKLALTLANLVQMPVSPLPQATYPEISRQVARRNWDNVRHVMRKGSLLAGSYSLAATLFLLVAGYPLIQILYTAEYTPAFPALIILLVGYLITNTFYWRRTALLALGQPEFATKLNLILAGVKVIGILLLVPVFGYLANAGLLAGFYLVGATIATLKVRSLLAQQEAENPGLADEEQAR